MSDTTFFEITFPVGAEYGVEQRHEIEDRLDEVLQQAGLGEVTGGGTGTGEANVDLEIADPLRGLALVREILKSFAVPPNTVIRQAGFPSINHNVYEPSASSGTGTSKC